MISLADIRAAHERIRSGIYRSPCQPSIPLSELIGSRVFCKLDLLQRTGSFKERGARNALLLLDAAQQRRGVIAASAGNHALGLAYHGSLLGIPVTVVMPRFAPLVKVATCRRLGATVILEGDTFDDARRRALEIAEADGLMLIHGFNDPAVIAGQGTMALEILEDVPDADTIVVPTGGAGLLAGVAVAAKALRPEIQIIAVEAAASASFGASLTAGRPVAVPSQPTLADGLAVGCVGSLSFSLAAPLVDRVVTLGEDAISLAMLRLLELEKMVVEGAAASALAAVMGETGRAIAGRTTVLLVCGGNIDLTMLDRVIDHGLVADGRRWRFRTVISDRPGGIARLAAAIAATGASIREIRHERAFSGADVFTTTVEVTVETADREHIAALRDRLAAANFVIARE
ncbi:MAG: threonine ammonia-lyase [Planctomycetota bacterium]|jgi:threonine dehydratase|nr:threonine ammonia-lyase [Planctomycetota bacterium]